MRYCTSHCEVQLSLAAFEEVDRNDKGREEEREKCPSDATGLHRQ